MNGVVKLKERLAQVTAERDYLASLVEAFREGRPPRTGASLQHFIFARWGRKRLEEQQATPALLRGVDG